jgi:uncharacterized protein YjbI with pentapeptide repeats
MAEEKGEQAAGEKKGRKPWTLKEVWGKTVWDWLGLLLVPLVLGIGAVILTAWFNAQQDARQLRIEAKRAKAERELAEQRAQDEQLQAYLDQMSTLLLDDLSNDKVQTLIRARTVTVLSRMDPGRKTQVMQFLDEVDLLQQRVDERVSINPSFINPEAADLRSVASVDESTAAISLEDADLSGADLAEMGGPPIGPHSHLRAADLTEANLTDTNLIGADLTDAKLIGANLKGANLTNANLSGADLTGANVAPEQLLDKVASLKGTTLPNGQKYEDWLKSKEGRGEDGKNSGPS